MTLNTLKQNKKNLLVQFVGGALVGGVGAFLMIRHGPDLDVPGVHAPGLLVATLLGILGLAILLATFTRAGAQQMVGAELEPGEDIRPELKSLRRQAFVTLLAAVELLILSMAPDFLTGPRKTILLVLLAATLTTQTWFNFELWHREDELFRRIIVEASVIGFLAFQFVLFFWVVGSRFAFVPDPSALDIYVLMLVLYLVGSGVVSIRHGYGASA